MFLSALAETETALAAQTHSQAQHVALREADCASAEAARLVRLRYENGATDFLIVLDAERRDLEAANLIAVSQTEVAQAQIGVFRVIEFDHGGARA